MCSLVNNSKFATCEEILFMFPELKNKLNWTVQDIGTAVKMKLIVGEKRKTTTYVKIESIKSSIEIINQNLESLKIKK